MSTGPYSTIVFIADLFNAEKVDGGRGWDFKNGQEGLDYYRLLPYRSGN
jgi:hypothetical protein